MQSFSIYTVLETSSITTPNQKQFLRYIFQSFFRENIGDFTELHTGKKISLEVPCKWNRFGYWNSCKRLPNFVNVAALPSNNVSMQVWSKSFHWFKVQRRKTLFWTFQSAGVTLKIRSTSPKSNQLFPRFPTMYLCNFGQNP